MNPIVTLSIVAVLILLIGIGLLAFLKSRKRKLSGNAQQKVQSAWRHVESVRDPNMQVMEADKVLDLALHLLGYKGSLGDKLKKAGPRFSDVNAVWNAHKLRNRIAHEVRTQISHSDAERALHIFRKSLRELGM